jgi:hypothetical protein
LSERERNARALWERRARTRGGGDGATCFSGFAPSLSRRTRRPPKGVRRVGGVTAAPRTQSKQEERTIKRVELTSKGRCSGLALLPTAFGARFLPTADLSLFLLSLRKNVKKNQVAPSSSSCSPLSPSLILVVVRAQLAGHVLLLVKVERIDDHLARGRGAQDVVDLHLLVLVLLVVLEEAVESFVVSWLGFVSCCVGRLVEVGASVVFSGGASRVLFGAPRRRSFRVWRPKQPPPAPKKTHDSIKTRHTRPSRRSTLTA